MLMGVGVVVVEGVVFEKMGETLLNNLRVDCLIPSAAQGLEWSIMKSRLDLIDPAE